MRVLSAHDKAGNQTSLTDAADETTTTTYNAMDRVATVEDADDGTTTYTYTEDGQLYTLTDPDSNVTTYTYNAINEQTEVTSPSVNSGSGESSTTEYDADGEVIETTDADGRQITYSYDQVGDQTGETWLNGDDAAIYIATFTYDNDREMTGADNPNATETFTYDNGGNLETEATSGPGTGQPTLTSTYSYNPSGDVTSVSDSLSGSGATGRGITTYAYDNILQLTTITQSIGGTAGPEVTMTYDPAGLVATITRSIAGTGDDVYTTYGYDSAENLTTISNQFGIEGHITLESGELFDASFNSDGQMTSAVVEEGLVSTTNTYSYDDDSQLTASSGGTDDSYGYDANGNQNSTGFTTGAGNEMTNSPGVTYTYDNNGNMITATTGSGTTTYTYDYENRLTNVEIDGTMVATYTYDALGRRIGIDDSGTQTWTVFNGTSADANPYADFNSSGTLKMRYVDGLAVDELFARTDSSGNTAWYLTDQVGSVVAIASTSAVLDQITYDPFGNIVTQTDSAEADRFLFAGMEYDSNTGLYFDHARYYDAAIGRFVSQDPEGFGAGDTNLYRYVGNEPTASVDPSGMIGDPMRVISRPLGKIIWNWWNGNPSPPVQPTKPTNTIPEPPVIDPPGTIVIPIISPIEIPIPPNSTVVVVQPYGKGPASGNSPVPVPYKLWVIPGPKELGPTHVKIIPGGPLPTPPKKPDEI